MKMSEDHTYFREYMDEKFANISDKIDGTNRRIDFIANDVKDLKAQKKADHDAMEKQIALNAQAIHDAKLTGKVLKWVYLFLAGIIGFVVAQLDTIMGLFRR